MAFRKLLLPREARYFTGQRWVNIALRSAHLVGIAGIGGGFLFNVPETQWLAFWHLALASGVALCLLYVWSTALWLLQLKGGAIIAKLVLLALAEAVPSWRAPLFVAIVLISAGMAHAPGKVRGWRWWPSAGGSGSVG